ncbi:MAG: hypothetical protein AMJ69_01760 [Gammaproteobacteria bacterium SG8_47]|nr:MAG: hypothetical protein AMJ69_01760 [Gammaproteobacteria bacterium SG8_47]
MNKHVLIFRHLECEGPGYLADYLDQAGIAHRLIRIDCGESAPEQLEPDVAGLVFMGGPMSVNDPLPWLNAELNLVRAAAKTGLPVLGHCLGGQIISKALGATIAPMGFREIGWHPVERCDNAAPSEWLGELPASFDAFHWHGEHFTLPTGAQHLLRSAACEHQAYALGNMLALQCHVEMTPALVHEWCRLYARELDAPTGSVQDAEAMTAGLDTKTAQLNRIADTLYGHWISRL